MTCKQIDLDRWQLSFSEPEAIFIINVLAWLGRHYREDVSQMPPALRAYWQGSITRGDNGEKEELKQSQEVLSEARDELRSDRLNLVETWLQEFELAEVRDPWLVELSSTERDEFISMLNDRRLLLSLEHGVTQADMEADVSEIPNEKLQASILEIDVLGHFILVMLGPQIYRPLP
jgi:hypothetical protein